MPKETFDDGGFDLVVGWDRGHTIQLGIDGGREFDFHEDDTDDGPYTGLWFTLYNEKQVNDLIKVLHKAKRKVFK